MRPDEYSQGSNLRPNNSPQSHNGLRPQSNRARTLFSPPVQLPGTQFNQYSQPPPNLPTPQQVNQAVPSMNPAQFTQISPTQSKRHTKRNLLIITATVAVIFIGLTSFYALYYLPRRPDAVVAKALAGTMQLLLQGQMSANVSGLATYTSTEQQGRLRSEISGSLNASQGFSITATNTLSQAEESQAFKTSLQTSDYNDYYVKLDANDRPLPDAPPEQPGIAQPTGENEGIYQLIETIQQTNDKTWLKITDEQFKEVLKQQREDQAADARIPLVRLAVIYRSAPFISVDEVVGVEDISGQESRHYKVMLSHPQLRAFLGQVKAQQLSFAGFGDKDVDLLISRINNGFSTFDVWINEQGYVNQLSFEFKPSDGEVVRIRLTLSDIGTPQPVIKPNDSESLRPLLEEVLGVNDTNTVAPSTETPGGRDAERKADIKAIQSKIEEFYALNGSYPLKLSDIKDLAAELCRDPGGSGTCATPDYGYVALRFSSSPSVTVTTDCNNSSEQCQKFILFSSKMEAETNPYSVTSE